MSVKRHLVILLVLTVLIRGVMFISYPIGGGGDNQSAQRYLIDRILAGDLLVGNVRYNTGYPLAIAPVAALAEQFGRFDERVILFAQVTLSSLIPFLLYDILRTRHSPKAAFFIVLLSLADPFGLQWAHFSLPVWLVACCLVFSLWLLHHADRRRSWRLVVAAGLVAGVGVLGRLNFALVALGIGLLQLFMSSTPLRHRIQRLLVFGGSSVLVLLLHLTLIHFPSTKTWELSCVAGLNWMEVVSQHGSPVRATNGRNSERLLALASLAPLRELDYTAESYPRWSNPESWASADEYEAFIGQERGEIPEQLTSLNWWGTLNYYLGPCETNELLRGAAVEAILIQPLRWLRGAMDGAFTLLKPELALDAAFPGYTLPRADMIEYERAGGVFGFMRAMEHEASYYNGHWVWRPGIELFTLLWAPLNALRFLVFPALVWALFTRWRIYSALAFLLLLYVIVISAADSPPEPRIYAIVYPLAPVLVGGMLVAVWERLRPILGR